MSSPSDKKDGPNKDTVKNESTKPQLHIKTNSKRHQPTKTEFTNHTPTDPKKRIKNALRKTKSDTSILASFNASDFNLTNRVTSPTTLKKTTTLFCIDPQVSLSFELKFV